LIIATIRSLGNNAEARKLVFNSDFWEAHTQLSDELPKDTYDFIDNKSLSQIINSI
jgi:hypothetical protein